MISEHIGALFSWARDGVARGLLRVGVRPNHVTVLGMLFTIGAGVAIAAGRPWWPWAVVLIVCSGGCDMLDGALANLGDRKTRFGAVLDSFCDRLSDAALYFGPAFYFIARPDDPAGAAPNLTMALLACLGLVWAYVISYTRARAGDIRIACDGGFWQRGERVVTILLGTAFFHVGTAVWILGLWPLSTVANRLWCTRRACRLIEQEEGAAGAEDGTEPDVRDAPRETLHVEPTGALKVLLWGYRRGSLPFDLHAGAVIALLVFADFPTPDLLREWMF